jgi:uncharacterized protein (DUF58 family)
MSAPLRLTAGLGAALLACAIVFDAEPLYVPAVALLLAAAAAVVWVRLGVSGVRIERELGVRRAVEDDPVALRVNVHSGFTVLPGTVLADPLLAEPLRLRAGARLSRVRIEARFARRGRRVLPAPAVEGRDPLGLSARRVEGTGEPDTLLVLPRIAPVVAADRSGEGEATGRRRAPAGAAEVEIDGVRSQRPGTPASRLFWPSLARGGELLERRLLPEAEARPIVVLDARAPSSEEDLDAAVRATASLAVHLAKAGGCALLLPGERRPADLDPPLVGWAQLHVRLALLPGGLGPVAGALAARRGPVLWVSANRVDAIPRALARVGSPARTLVVPGELPRRHAVFTVAGCSGYALAARELVGRAA